LQQRPLQHIANAVGHCAIEELPQSAVEGVVRFNGFLVLLMAAKPLQRACQPIFHRRQNGVLLFK
jgi:hypothetical protein